MIKGVKTQHNKRRKIEVDSTQPVQAQTDTSSKSQPKVNTYVYKTVDPRLVHWRDVCHRTTSVLPNRFSNYRTPNVYTPLQEDVAFVNSVIEMMFTDEFDLADLVPFIQREEIADTMPVSNDSQPDNSTQIKSQPDIPIFADEDENIPGFEMI